MPRKPKVTPPPCGVRTLPSGRITLQIRALRNGESVRLSQRALKSDEPASYATMEDAVAGYQRVMAYLAEQVDHEQTVAGFAKRWLDEHDPRWGVIAYPDRGPETRVVYASRIARFVKMFGDRQMATINEADVVAYRRVGKLSQMRVISTFLRDAAADKLRVGDPAKDVAKQAEKALARHRQDRPDAPTMAQIEAVLRHMKLHLDIYPRSFYGWLLTGVRTGMRGAEIDGMQFEYVDEDSYLVRWQLHHRTNTLSMPKWVREAKECRRVILSPDVLDEIRHQRRERMALDGWGMNDYIWLNTEGGPWRHDARDKWWDKRVGGTSLRQICGGVPIYNATRHHWASHMLNVEGVSAYEASLLFGHKDGGKTIVDRYLTKRDDRALDTIRRVHAQRGAAVIPIGTRREPNGT